MEKEKVVSQYFHEGTVAVIERTIRRLWILCIILVVLLVATNGLWIWYNSQFEYFTITQENEDGYNNYIGNDGDIINGETNDQR